jgi:hypothetical protein
MRSDEAGQQNTMPEEPDESIAHVRVCGGSGRAISCFYPAFTLIQGAWKGIERTRLLKAGETGLLVASTEVHCLASANRRFADLAPEAGADWARFRQNSEISGGQSEEQEPVHQAKPECEPISRKALWTKKKFPFALCAG